VCAAASNCTTSCSPPAATATCATSGYLSCDSVGHCCPPGTPYGCISSLSCYATQAEATADCGASCTVCGGSTTSCRLPVATTTCATAGYVPCDSSHCCPPSAPYGCVSDLTCHATQAEAIADCGTACLVCGG
jgi:hypothetical protein